MIGLFFIAALIGYLIGSRRRPLTQNLMMSHALKLGHTGPMAVRNRRIPSLAAQIAAVWR